MKHKFDCPSCGKTISDCPHCGASLSPEGFIENFKNTAEYKVIEDRLRQKFEDNIRVKIRDLESVIEEKTEKILEHEKHELELRKMQREYVEKERAFKLEMQRHLDTERKKIEDEISEKITFESNLKVAEKNSQLEAMQRQIKDLQRKSEQGSMQAQGEGLEVTIEETLREDFKTDLIEPVPKGVRGADIIQKIRSINGHSMGSIIWESKRTMHWKDEWLEKLKQDQREAGAEIAVIVTQTMPKGVLRFRYIDGVWVTDYQNYLSLAVALRQSVVGIYQAKSSTEATEGTMALLYEYVTGKNFVNKVESLVDLINISREEFEKEKRAMQKIWSIREMQIKKAQYFLVGLYGECRGIVGHAMPVVNSLELPSSE